MYDKYDDSIIRAEGRDAFFMDKSIDENPYHPTNTIGYGEWRSGWKSGYEDAKTTWQRSYFNKKFGIEEAPTDFAENSRESIKHHPLYIKFWFLIYWCIILTFAAGALASAFSTLASIIHFQIFGAVGYFVLMVVCFGVTGFFKGIVDEM